MNPFIDPRYQFFTRLVSTTIIIVIFLSGLTYLLASSYIPPQTIQNTFNFLDLKKFHQPTSTDLQNMQNDLLTCTKNSDCTYALIIADNQCQFIAGNTYFLSSFDPSLYCTPTEAQPFDYLSCTNNFCTKRTLPFSRH